MRDMKTPLKISLIIIALILLTGLVCLVWLGSQTDEWDEPVATSGSDPFRGPSFAVNVAKPRLGRPLFGIFPTKVEAKLFGGGELRFDHTSPGARIGMVGQDHFELSADGWNLLLETDAKGGVAPGTRLVFPILLAERQRTLRCRPGDRVTGYLQATKRAGSDVLDGRFLVELATCENAETGQVIEWPPAPLTVRGSFAGLPIGPSIPLK